ncbi:MAG: prepilin-type N-terminal cleavage/methylation domain-containing protein [Pirellulales bacterium]|nr:prepilin-type N-terminal cleavage/methylation domain-containing protein [Pirellulales bacterium]
MNSRRGFSLLEALVSCLLLAALTTLCLELVGASANQRKAAALRQIALEEAANAMERVFARRWEELAPEATDKAALSREGKEALPGNAMMVRVQPSDAEPSAKQITVEVRWEPSRGKPSQQVRLVALRYRAARREEASRP